MQSIPIPDSILDELAERIAGNVARKLTSVLIDQIRQAAPLPIAENCPVSVTFLRMPEVAKRTGLSRATIYTQMNEGAFPSSVKLGPRSVAWRRVEVEQWEANPTGYSMK